MTALLLDCHGDDAVLFSCFNLIRHKPHVVVCLRSQVQWDRGTGITFEEREEETGRAFDLLDVDWEQCEEPDVNPDWLVVESRIREAAQELDPYLVIAPAHEDGGHEQHNVVSRLASAIFPSTPIISYMTYRRGYGRSEGIPVDPAPAEIIAKHRALALFESQIREFSTRPWFVGTIREWVA